MWCLYFSVIVHDLMQAGIIYSWHRNVLICQLWVQMFFPPPRRKKRERRKERALSARVRGCERGARSEERGCWRSVEAVGGCLGGPWESRPSPVEPPGSRDLAAPGLCSSCSPVPTEPLARCGGSPRWSPRASLFLLRIAPVGSGHDHHGGILLVLLVL